MTDYRKDFEAYYPMAVWDENLQGYTDPKFTYAYVGWEAAMDQLELYAYDVPTEGGTELAYAIYYEKYYNKLPEGSIPLYAIKEDGS